MAYIKNISYQYILGYYITFESNDKYAFYKMNLCGVQNLMYYITYTLYNYIIEFF